MMERLYYQDPYLMQFEARVVEQRRQNGLYGLVLDRTAFYPGGGGQPDDRGWLNQQPVVKVSDEEGTIVHWLKTPIQEARVHGQLDFHRRFDFMQQHTGQHILSACLLQELDCETISVHFGEQYTAVEIDCQQVQEAQIQRVEELANQVVQEARAVRTHWIKPSEIHLFPLRKIPPAVEKIRVVEIEELDWSACGGTHVWKTSEVGPIKFLQQEKIRGRLRLHWLIGNRLRKDFSRKQQVLGQLSVTLSCGTEDLPAKVAQLISDRKWLARRAQFLENLLLEPTARQLMDEAEPVGALRLVAKNFADHYSAQFLRALLQKLIENPGVVAFLCGQHEPNTHLWLIGHARNLDLKFSQMLPDLLPMMGACRGGGKGNIWQGKCTGKLAFSSFVKALKDQLKREQPDG